MDVQPSVHQFNGLFDNPMVIEIFLYCVNRPEGISIREAQRDLKIPNSSSLHWHLSKLMDAKLVDQDEQKSYHLTELGKSINSIEIPVKQKFLIFRGVLYPTSVFQLSFLITSLVFAVLLMTVNTFTATIFLILVVVVEISEKISTVMNQERSRNEN